MATVDAIQALPKRLMGEHLKMLREQADLTLEYVAGRLGKTSGTLSRQENGYTLCTWDALNSLLLLYGASDEDTKEAQRLWKLAKQPREKLNVSGRNKLFPTLTTSERYARVMSEVTLLLVPGLLQAEEYAREIFRIGVGGTDEALVAQALKARSDRQKVLIEGDQVPQFNAYLDEAVLHRTVGGPDVMTAQFDRLIELGKRPNISIRVVPFSAGMHAFNNGNVIMHEFGGNKPPFIYHEHMFGGVETEDKDSAVKVVAQFDQLAKMAASEKKSAEMFRHHRRLVKG
ncbi:helix-turn-helix domain-containing protein [Amycolatopsis anabasis]|uniref:helix-turn-helix domain-containing protein n=1 Tax=Amycolatopsis anabasis TaxID=1840409 RepID=UPI00131D8145|nr:helix-turn-helix transcriptional regulator [Amycolatopsis anabasis]